MTASPQFTLISPPFFLFFCNMLTPPNVAEKEKTVDLQNSKQYLIDGDCLRLTS